MIYPMCARPSNPAQDRRIPRSCPGGTGRPGRQLNGTSARVERARHRGRERGPQRPSRGSPGSGHSAMRGGRRRRSGWPLVAGAAADGRAAGPTQPAASRITAQAARPITLAAYGASDGVAGH
jgi:hypothetical protein